MAMANQPRPRMFLSSLRFMNLDASSLATITEDSVPKHCLCLDQSNLCTNSRSCFGSKWNDNRMALNLVCILDMLSLGFHRDPRSMDTQKSTKLPTL
jgi:hypothetical protein